MTEKYDDATMEWARNLADAIVRDVLHRQPIGNDAIAKMAELIAAALHEAEARGAREAWARAITRTVAWSPTSKAIISGRDAHLAELEDRIPKTLTCIKCDLPARRPSNYCIHHSPKIKGRRTP